MIQNDKQLHQARADIQELWKFLESARRTHSSIDYERMARPISYKFKNASKRS